MSKEKPPEDLPEDEKPGADQLQSAEGGDETVPGTPAEPTKKPRNVRAIILNLALLLMVLFIGYAVTSYVDHGVSLPLSRMPAPPVVAPVPSFTFTDLNGKPHELKEFTGKTILINFWATWCPPCLEEFPKLLNLAGVNRDKIVLIALSADIEEAHIRSYLQRQEIPPGNVFIAWDKDDIAHSVFGISKLPETVVVDRDINERTRIIGSTWQSRDVQQIIDSLEPEPK